MKRLNLKEGKAFIEQGVFVMLFLWENYFYDGDVRKWNATPFMFAYTQNWETKSNSTMILDAFIATSKFGFDLTYNSFENRTDNSLFYGFGLGWHAGFQYSDPIIDDWGDTYSYESVLRHGPAILAQVGYIFMRTYDVNVMVRAKYHFQFSTLEGNYDNISLLVFPLLKSLTLSILLKAVETKEKLLIDTHFWKYF